MEEVKHEDEKLEENKQQFLREYKKLKLDESSQADKMA